MERHALLQRQKAGDLCEICPVIREYPHTCLQLKQNGEFSPFYFLIFQADAHTHRQTGSDCIIISSILFIYISVFTVGYLQK